MRRQWILMAALAAIPAGAEILDRVAASINHQVITESEVLEEIRVAAFLNGEQPDFSADQKRTVLDRLIDQELMRREMTFTRFPLPAPSEIDPLYIEVRKRFPDESAYQVALKRYAITDADVRRHLQWQLMTLRFIEFRFQPGVEVSPSDLDHEYDAFTRNWRASHTGTPPALDEVRAELEKIVRQRLVDSALDRWLGEARTQNDIIYRKGYEPE